jgi:hypothetical protein
MHFKLRGTLGIGIPVLLGTALVAGATALPARATTWQDTALNASAVADATFGGAGLSAANNTDKTVITLSGTGVTWSLHGTPPAGVTLSGTTISYTGDAVTSPPVIVADATDSTGNAQALEITVTIGSGTIQETGFTKVSLSTLADTNNAGTVTFTAATSKNGDTINFAETNLPTGLTSGNPVLTYVGGTAAPGTYAGVVATATDADGAVLHGTFSLTVTATAAVGSYGNEVNKFGNGLDAFRQHQFAGAVIAGWPATQHDPATHFLLNAGSHAGAFQFEYAPKGTGSGLCVSDPGGGWRSDPLPDGLILTHCNTGPWQQFVPQSNGSLQNVATGLFINPNGTGGQLRGGASLTSWGGSSYKWTDFSSLPS